MVWFAVALLAVMAGYLRLVPADPQRWHVDLAGLAAELAAGPAGEVRSGRNSAAVWLDQGAGEAASALAALDAIALASGRTRRFAGAVTEGHVTWESRSLVWGFPDYTTAQIIDGKLVLLARSRFGGNDWGVNAARLTDWLSQL